MNRKAFNFYKSYYDVAVELPDEERNEFVWSIVSAQFTGQIIEPKGKLARLMFLGQKHSILKQLEGFKAATKPPTEGPTEGPTQQVQVQVQGQGQDKEQVQEEVEVKEKGLFVFIGEKKIFDVLPILEFYEAQLNGTQKENGGLAWRGIVDKWFNQNIGQAVIDNNHAKNSFKKHYLNQKKNDWKGNKGSVVPEFSGDYSGGF